MTEPDHVWQQIERLVKGADESITLIAPFIKKSIFEEIIAAVPASVNRIDCFTRWTPAEVAAGVSDPEIIERAEADARLRIALCPSLHAKVYVADERCLVGSANLTARATGRAPHANFELLIEAEASHPEVQRVLTQVKAEVTPATPHHAALIRKQADLLHEENVAGGGVVEEWMRLWYPVTRRPQNLYALYAGRAEFAPAVAAGIVQDLALLDIPVGLTESEFNDTVRSRLTAIPELHKLRSGETLSNIELQRAIEERSGVSEAQARRVTENIAAWLKHFDRFYTEVGSWELREGRELA